MLDVLPPEDGRAPAEASHFIILKVPVRVSYKVTAKIVNLETKRLIWGTEPGLRVLEPARFIRSRGTF